MYIFMYIYTKIANLLDYCFSLHPSWVDQLFLVFSSYFCKEGKNV